MTETELFTQLMAIADAGDAILIVIGFMVWRIGNILKGGFMERTNAWRILFTLIKIAGRRDLRDKVPEQFRQDFPKPERNNDD